MQKFWARVLVFASALVAALVAVIRTVLEMVGYSTAGDDAAGVPDRAAALFDIIITQPVLVIYGLPLLSMLVGGGILLLSWAAERPSKVPAQIYVRAENDADGIPDRIVASWSPTSFFDISLRLDGMPTSTEVLPAVMVTNIGPGALRHVRAKWTLRGTRPSSVVKRSKVFGSCLAECNKSRFVLVGEGRSMRRPFATEAVTEIPLLMEGDFQKVEVPKDLLLTWVVTLLAAAKMWMDRNPAAPSYSGIKEIWKELEASTFVTAPINLCISAFTESGSRVSKNYAITGYYLTRVQATFVPEQPGSSKYVHETGGVSTAFEHMCIVEL